MSVPRCTREGCEAQLTGQCLEGFEPLSTCPYLPSETESDPKDLGSQRKAFVDLPTGEALGEVQASEIARAEPTRVVVVAGPPDSGKTTILTSLFESFLDAPFGSFLFAGSRTLVGFEKRCHSARQISGNPQPETLHTPITDLVEFLHLRVRSVGRTPSLPQSVLISDISGERFRALRDSLYSIDQMKVLKRADTLVITVDGQRLANPNERQSARTDARLLLRSLLEADALSSHCRLDIVISKWDLVVADASAETVKSFVTQMKDALTALAGERRIQFHEVAARPTTERLPFAHGLPTLFRGWLEPFTRNDSRTIYLPRLNERAREISRYAHSVASEFRLGEAYDVRWI